MNRKSRVIGLTGNIGTGKSTVAFMFSELDIPIIDADEIAHDVIAPNSSAWKQIFERYGKIILENDNVINRKSLAQIVFQDPIERKFLESVIHPHVLGAIEHEVAALAKNGNRLIIVEVPLLFETGWENKFDCVIVVKCDEKNEIDRCMKKFNVDKESIALRLAAQHPLNTKIEKATFVIDNSKTLDHTKRQVIKIKQDLEKMFFN